MSSRSFLTSRRLFLQGAAVTGLLAATPQLLLAQAATSRRFVFVIQRGGADGLETVVPYADPAYARLRGGIALDPATLARIDGLFGLHPALVETARLHAAREALFVHAVASPYRDRSHFDGQNVLETGGAVPYARKDGWLNRLVGLLPGGGEAIAITPTVPLALRGPAKAGSHAPSALPQAPDDLMQSVRQMYGQDPQLSALWSAAMESRGMAGTPVKQNPAELGALAARFLAQPAGPRIAMLETGGWDTHSFQPQRHANQLKGLDAMIAALREGMGPAWAETVVLVATEFGRTAAVNGTSGTDHGTASAAMLLGGAVDGGRVLGDWPGLAPQALYEGRDLQPTTRLDGLIAGVAGECFGLEPALVERTLFQQGAATPALPRLLRS